MLLLPQSILASAASEMLVFAITEEDNLDFERAEGGRGKLRGQECKAS